MKKLVIGLGIALPLSALPAWLVMWLGAPMLVADLLGGDRRAVPPDA